MEAHCASETALFLGARPCSVLPPAVSNEQSACACAQEKNRHRALSIEGRRNSRLCGARLLRRADWSRLVFFLEAHCPIETALSLGARPCSDVPVAASNEEPAFECAHTRTRQHALSLGRRHSTCACGARALRRAGCSWLMVDRSPLRHRDGPIPRCTAVLRHASCGLQRAAGVPVCAHANAPPRALSLGRRRVTSACDARALRRGGLSRPMPYESSLRQRDGPLPPCTAALGLASSGLQKAAGLRVYARQNATALSLSGGGAARALMARAHCAALVAVGLSS